MLDPSLRIMQPTGPSPFLAQSRWGRGRGQRFGHRWRWLGKVLLLVSLGWSIGFGWYLTHILRMVPPSLSLPQPGEKSAALILTGGAGRIAGGLSLLQQGYVEQVLISGVCPSCSKLQLASVLPEGLQGVFARYHAHITLGYSADDTIGNAKEASGWVEQEGIHTLYVVTSSYHMPRSLLLCKRAMPHLTLKAYPVPELYDWKHWWSSSFDWSPYRRLFTEYHKLLLTGWHDVVDTFIPL